jgi:hypothetical protein
MTAANANILFLLLFIGCAALHVVWISRLATLLERLEHDSGIVVGLSELASSGEGGSGKNYRRAIVFLLRREYRKYGNVEVTKLGNRIVILMGATAVLCVSGVAVLARI